MSQEIFHLNLEVVTGLLKRKNLIFTTDAQSLIALLLLLPPSVATIRNCRRKFKLAESDIKGVVSATAKRMGVLAELLSEDERDSLDEAIHKIYAWALNELN